MNKKSMYLLFAILWAALFVAALIFAPENKVFWFNSIVAIAWFIAYMREPQKASTNK